MAATPPRLAALRSFRDAPHHLGMTSLNRTHDIRVSAGPALGRRLPRRPISLIGLAVRSLIAGVAIGTFIGAGWALTPLSTLTLGGAALVWLLLSFEGDRPEKA